MAQLLCSVVISTSSCRLSHLAARCARMIARRQRVGVRRRRSVIVSRHSRLWLLVIVLAYHWRRVRRVVHASISTCWCRRARRRRSRAALATCRLYSMAYLIITAYLALSLVRSSRRSGSVLHDQPMTVVLMTLIVFGGSGLTTRNVLLDSYDRSHRGASRCQLNSERRSRCLACATRFSATAQRRLAS